MKVTQPIRLSDADVRCILPSPDGLIIAANCSDRSVRLYEVAGNGAHVATLTFQTAVLSICWAKTFNSPHSLACLCSDGNVRLRKLDPNYLLPSDARHTVIKVKDGDLAEGIVAFHADGDQLAIGFPGEITVWSLTAKAPSCHGGLYTSTEPQPISHIQFLSGHRLLVFFTHPGNIVEYDLKTNTIISQSRLWHSIVSVALSANDTIAIEDLESGLQAFRLCARGHASSVLRSSNVQTSAVRTLYRPGSARSSTCLLFIREDVLVSATENGELRVWNIDTGNCYGSLSARDGTVDQLSTIALLPPQQSIAGGIAWDARIALGGSTGLRIMTLRFPAEQDEAFANNYSNGSFGQHGFPIPRSHAAYDPTSSSLEWVSSTVLVRALNFALLLAALSMLSRD